MLRAVALAMVVAGPAVGEGARPTIAEAMNAVIGTEVAISGKYGKDNERAVLFHTDGGWYAVDLALDRETTKSLSHCRHRDPSDSSPCYIKGTAEIAVDRNDIRLIIFEVTEITSERPN